MKEQLELLRERYELAVSRIKLMEKEDGVDAKYRPFFVQSATFVLRVINVYEDLIAAKGTLRNLAEYEQNNQALYEDILPKNYAKSYANPAYAQEVLGEEYGGFLATIYTELRGMIVYAYEQKLENLVICLELFIQIYHCFEEEAEPSYKEVQEILYWYVSDYAEVLVAERIREQILPEYTFATDIIQNSDLSDMRYLYLYGEYISENEIKTAKHMNALPQEMIDKMAEVYTEGYRRGFINGNKDLSKKEVVNIRYTLGFERVVRKAIENFQAMGLRPTIFRSAVSILTKRQHLKIGYYGAIANKQYDYDHKEDQSLVLDKRLIERKLEVVKTTYETWKQEARKFAGPAVMEIFGEEPFSPEQKKTALHLSEEQKTLDLLYESKAAQITNEYIKGEERSFTIIAYPSPEIGSEYETIFNEIVKINTLDADLYERVQQTLIDALDEGDYVHVLGEGENRTDLRINLHTLKNKEKETIFENCVADVNIPVGEVFTSPVLKGTTGILHVSKVYLRELQYRDLEFVFKDGMIVDYSCGNFKSVEEGKRYIRENILMNHETLPMGEFAIGTNTTAYVVAKKYQIEDKMPILIAEKTGPHFALGDTCYKWSEDNQVYNQNGKEIVAKDNEVSLLRKEGKEEKAYYNCHTDVTIPYEELAHIRVITHANKEIVLLKDGRFVLPGCEVLNAPFDADR